MIKNIYFLTCLLFAFSATTAIAQSSCNSSGQKILGINGATISYSIGQAVVNSSIENGYVSSGVHQPYEILILVGVDVKDIDLFDISAYPNPVIDFLQIEVGGNHRYEQLSYRLFDSQGKLLSTSSITSGKTRVEMSSYLSGVFFLYVMRRNIKLKVFKIIKT
ncbi:T9SS type A sorting domain-containing protein [Halosquirtibacter laminarini]|uniref:T9SS type A sorting domain-containing protein n=1 Tax=Halosquirtibacter laminarini TaxID=3374600 RepID=A0AC61NC33_9BACT|nr:T9SS type A sorting domain-containing protein [Prolixibacteraceae bacterium]